jgi:hypothetical protein
MISGQPISAPREQVTNTDDKDIMRLSRLASILSATLAVASITVSLAVSAQAQTETTLFSFPGGSAGSAPDTGLVRDASGNLYGVTEE